MASEEQQDAQEATAPAPAHDPAVGHAFALGWQVARLHRRASPRRDLKPAAQLPGASELPSGVRTEMGIEQVRAGLHALAGRLEAAAVEPPDTGALVAALRESSAAQIKERVYELHAELLVRLTAADFRLGKAYGLGRALADTGRVASLEDLDRQLGQFRVAQLQEWLADLSTALPQHAARAVALSLGDWRAWLEAARDGIVWETHGTRVHERLVRQTHVWRALISGEKEAVDMLGADDYASAADRLVERGRTVARASLRRYRSELQAVALVLLVAVVGIVAAVALDRDGGVVAGIGAAAAALGLSWRGIGSTLTGLVRELREPLWRAELDHAVAEAISCVPERVAGQAAPVRAATPPAGPRASAAPAVAPDAQPAAPG